MSDDQLLGAGIILLIAVISLQLIKSARYQYIQKFLKPKRWR